MFNIPAVTMVPPEFHYPVQIDKSCMFDYASPGYLNRTNSGTVTDAYKITVSFWCKRSKLLSTQYLFSGKKDSDNKSYIAFLNTDQLSCTNKRNDNQHGQLVSNALFKDTGGWYHIHYIYDVANGTAVDRGIITINGLDMRTELGGFSVDNPPDPGNANRYIDNTEGTRICSHADSNSPMNGYMAEFYCLSSEVVDHHSFGEFKNGIWVPKMYTIGTNSEDGLSFKLDFKDENNLGNDVSVNAADFSEVNLPSTRQVIDTPTHNIAILDWNTKSTFADNLIDGGLKLQEANVHYAGASAAINLPKGKWYFEYDLGSDLGIHMVGICEHIEEINGAVMVASLDHGYASSVRAKMINSIGTYYQKVTGGSATNLTDLGTPEANEIIQIAVDVDAGKVWFGVDNVWTGSGVPEHGVNPTYSGLDTSGGIVPVVCTRSCITGSVNFGQRTFAHTPPEGFHPVAYKYLPEPTIMEGDIGVDVALWTGNTSTQHITGLKFKPDFVWIKDRLNLNNHCVFDVDRGATKWMRMDDASVAENTDVDSLTSFNADGFSLGDDIKVNVAARTYAGLCLRKGKKFGFDIQLYTGDGETSQLIDHKLGGTPELMVVWNRTQGRGTMMYHHHMANKTDPETDYITLDGPNNYVDLLAAWNDTKPTASQLTVGSHANCNENGESFVAWLWRSIPGFSKVWSFEGNGSAASGPFVYCGFKPRYILFRNADANNSWRWYDTRRNLYNYNSMNYIIPNGENVETAEAAMNIHTQGFRMTSGNDALNRNGYTHVGLALAEHPAKYANAR